ncbi:hypothetical protein L226DRAFT_615799 [Lentinus tigrinus ALCF2SS1-7]|uniref:Uncharacterized protein n=1 Tax=Lentinus tigrinus ALCF2SS1-6 TaxID=1328759 RepID=A0A5C2RZ39_9APHY|nr:hypothetical protein L227DRAFT_579021 [Lentinus tigrinus ALCF2SS1-6]RPD71079.1 hypothetical protein L226DRAFT_615799 [Lentinus tigrinus ALCF2SS1-7]
MAGSQQENTSSKSKAQTPSYVTLDRESHFTADPETLRQHSPTFRSKLSKTWHRFYPVIPLVYAGHIWFRRRLPRVLPRFTSLRLWELYASWGFYSALTTDTRHIQTQWVRDRDLATIQIGAYYIWLQNHRDLPIIQKIKYPEGVLSRSDVYPRWTDRGVVLAELVWWNNHMWSREQTWRGAAQLLTGHADVMVERGRKMDVDPHDWDRFITYIANAIEGPDGTKNYNLAFPVAQAFACVTPFAMLARHFLPLSRAVPWLNGLQRTLFYAAAYLLPMQQYQFYRYSADIQHKRQFAELLCDLFPGLDKNVDEVIRVSLPDHV